MCSYYLSAPECDAEDRRAVTDALDEALGGPRWALRSSFAARRLAARAYGGVSYTLALVLELRISSSTTPGR